MNEQMEEIKLEMEEFKFNKNGLASMLEEAEERAETAETKVIP